MEKVTEKERAEDKDGDKDEEEEEEGVIQATNNLRQASAWSILNSTPSLAMPRMSLGTVSSSRAHQLPNLQDKQFIHLLSFYVLYCRVMDEFAWNQTRMINIGDQKGPILRNAVRIKNPLHALELGTFAGYSAISIAIEMSRPGAKLISMDSSTNNADFAAQIIHFAGTDTNNKTRVYVGRAETHLLPIMKRESIQRFDFVFLDHDKKVYLSDFMYLLAQKVIGKGTVVVADNMIHPGAPDYLEYVQSQPDTMRTEVHKSVLEYSKEGKEDAVAVTELLK